MDRTWTWATSKYILAQTRKEKALGSLGNGKYSRQRQTDACCLTLFSRVSLYNSGVTMVLPLSCLDITTTITVSMLFLVDSPSVSSLTHVGQGFVELLAVL